MPKNTVNAAARSNTLLSRKTDSRDTAGVELGLSAQAVEAPREQAERAQEHEGEEGEEELADRALAEGVDRCR